MRAKQLNEIFKNIRQKLGFFSLLIFVILLILVPNLHLLSFDKNTKLNNEASFLSNSDSLTLEYDEINASNFPHIVSLVTVTNEAGFVIDKLNENNFEVREDSVREFPIEVIELMSPKIDINVVLAIDRSSSMEGQPINDAKLAASKFVELMQGNDKSAIVSFANEARTDYPFSSDKDLLKDAISKIEANGYTVIFDALVHSVFLMSEDLENRAIILLTDGADNSSEHTYQEALNALISCEVRVFTIGLGLNLNSPEENILKELANKTGGLYYYSPTSSDLEEIYKAIFKLLHHRYQISYKTHNPAKDGTLRHVRIDVIVNNTTSSDTANYRAPYDLINIIPNPFTPNEDGFNDRIEFRKGWYGIPLNWAVTIMELTGKVVKHLSNGETFWDGKDESGKLMLPGCYLYIIFDGSRAIHRGLIHLIR